MLNEGIAGNDKPSPVGMSGASILGIDGMLNEGIAGNDKPSPVGMSGASTLNGL